MTRVEAGLHSALDRLRDLVDPRDVVAVAELSRRLRHRRLRVLVVGEAKRGKSTMLNALLGRNVLPTGVVPLTAIATTVTYGDTDCVDVAFIDGRTETHAFDALGSFVTERGNPANQRGVAAVTVHTPAPLLRGGVELVDTPGTGSVHEHDDQASTALEKMDVAVFVVSADPPISAAERAWLREVRGQAVRVLCVLNKADYLDPTELAEALTFTREVIGEQLGEDIPVWPLSARAALTAAVEGTPADDRWSAFADAFTRYLTEAGDADLVASVTMRAARLAATAAEESDATLAALSMSERDLETRLAAFTEQLDKVEASRFEAAALARASFERLLRETSDQAEATLRDASPAVRRAVIERLATLDGSLREIENTAIDYAAEQIRRVVDGWRDRHTASLKEQLDVLDAALRSRVDEHVRLVRETASSLFSLDLVQLPPAGQLVDTRGFRYSFAPDVGQTEALAATVRTHLPGRAGRRRVDRYVLERTAILLDRQVGRSRADFAERLRETERQLHRALDERFDAGAGRIAEAVRRAADHRRATTEEVARTRAGAAQRRAAARNVMAELDALGRGATPGDARNVPA